MEKWKGLLFINSQIKVPHSKYRDHAIMKNPRQKFDFLIIIIWATRNLFILFQGKDGRPILPSRMMLVLQGRPQQKHRT